MKNKQLIIYGAGETAEIAYEYFTHDSDYEVVAFTVNEAFLKQSTFNNLPVVPFETIESAFHPQTCHMFVAAAFGKLNRHRMQMYHAAKEKGYTLASYISSRAFVWHTAQYGENVLIMENNIIQHKVSIGNNVILWSGNHIGHQSTVEDHVFISSHCVVSGFCTIGTGSFLGVNCTFNDRINLAQDNLVGSGSLIVKSTAPGNMMIGSPAKPAAVSTYQFFKLETPQS